MTARQPLWTALVVGLCITVYQLPALSSLLVFDRHAIEQGQLWRLATGHVVHFSSTHLIADVLGFAVTAGLIERLRLDGCAVLFMAMAIGICAVLFAFEPDMRFYGGLSGMVYGATTYVALFGLRCSRRYRAVGGLTLAAILLLLVRDFLPGEASALITREQPFKPVPLSHLAGVVVATTVFTCTRWQRVHAARV